MRLEPLRADHTEALFPALCGEGDEERWTYRATEMPSTLDEFARVVEPFLDHPPGATYVVVPDAGPSGMLTCWPCVPEHGAVELSSVLWGATLARSTAATEAVHLLLEHLFEDLGHRRVEWKCDSLNEPSRQAAVRYGFTFEGHFRQHMVTKGRNRDTDWFAMLDGEWPAVKARNERWLAPANFDGEGRQLRRLTDC
ncbi:GNAT family N-acetyltransferase [Nocardioides daphniae]|uniref:GNAT family N-acetyltransferase n=1 Tax=Nocardioides daphniae TaxID=402297 RepID=UPI001930EEA3|nr:GNAT family protein [Nocardioides daphniae]